LINTEKNVVMNRGVVTLWGRLSLGYLKSYESEGKNFATKKVKQ